MEYYNGYLPKIIIYMDITYPVVFWHTF